jgi:hypothetical protein
MRIMRLRPYVRAMASLQVDEPGMQRIEAEIASAPSAHPIIRGLRGVRKARFALPGRGKSGGGRVVYYLAISAEVILMIYAYPKNAKDDLNSADRRAVLAAVEMALKELKR